MNRIVLAAMLMCLVGCHSATKTALEPVPKPTGDLRAVFVATHHCEAVVRMRSYTFVEYDGTVGTLPASTKYKCAGIDVGVWVDDAPPEGKQ